MFLKFICKAFFAKNIVKSVGNSGINGRSSLPVLFPGQSTTFRQNKRPFSGKPGGPTGTNTAGKNDLLLFGFDMYPQYWGYSIGGTYQKEKLL